MDDNTKAKILYHLANDGVDSIQAIVPVADIFRSIGWALVKLLGNIDDALYSVILSINKYLSFGWSTPVKTLVENYKPFLLALLIVSFTLLGVRLLMHKAGEQLSIIQNVAICVIICVALPSMTATMGDFASKGVEGVLTSQTETTVSSSYKNAGSTTVTTGKNSNKVNISDVIVAGNLIDLKAVDKYTTNSGKVVWHKSNDPSKAIVGYFSKSNVFGGNWKKIDINSVLNYDTEGQLKQPDLWKWKFTDVNAYEKGKDNKDNLEELSASWFDDLHSYHHRWQVISWFNLIFELALVAIVLTLAMIKCFRLIIEVAMAQVYLPFIAASDLATGQRVKEGVKYLFSLFAAIFLCAALLGIFFIGFTYIQSQSWNFIIKIIFEIALAWAIIDGPNILERIIGIDVGMKSGWGMIMGIRGASGMARGVVNNAKSVGKAGVGAAAFGANAVAGKKTPKVAPAGDGKRHGGLRGAINGENKQMKDYAEQSRNDDINNKVGNGVEPNKYAKKSPFGNSGSTSTTGSPVDQDNSSSSASSSSASSNNAFSNASTNDTDGSSINVDNDSKQKSPFDTNAQKKAPSPMGQTGGSTSGGSTNSGSTVGSSVGGSSSFNNGSTVGSFPNDVTSGSSNSNSAQTFYNEQNAEPRSPQQQVKNVKTNTTEKINKSNFNNKKK